MKKIIFLSFSMLFGNEAKYDFSLEKAKVEYIESISLKEENILEASKKYYYDSNSTNPSLNNLTESTLTSRYGIPSNYFSKDGFKISASENEINISCNLLKNIDKYMSDKYKMFQSKRASYRGEGSVKLDIASRFVITDSIMRETTPKIVEIPQSELNCTTLPCTTKPNGTVGYYQIEATEGNRTERYIAHSGKWYYTHFKAIDANSSVLAEATSAKYGKTILQAKDWFLKSIQSKEFMLLSDSNFTCDCQKVSLTLKRTNEGTSDHVASGLAWIGNAYRNFILVEDENDINTTLKFSEIWVLNKDTEEIVSHKVVNSSGIPLDRSYLSENPSCPISQCP